MRIFFFRWLMVARNSWNEKKNASGISFQKTKVDAGIRFRSSLGAEVLRQQSQPSRMQALKSELVTLSTLNLYVEIGLPNVSNFRLERPGISQSKSIKAPGLCLTNLTHVDLLRSHASPVFRSFEARFLVKLFQMNNGKNNNNQNNEHS